MKNLLRALSKYRFFLLLLVCDLLLLALKPDLGSRSLGLTWAYVLEMLTVVPPIFVIMGLMDVWIPKETIMKYMGKGAGAKGGICAFLLGSFSSGPLYAAFPIACMFLKKGVSLVNVFLFLGAWSTTKLPMMLFEATQLGGLFTALRFVFNIVGTVVLAIVLEKTTSPQEQEALRRRAGELNWE